MCGCVCVCVCVFACECVRHWDKDAACWDVVPFLELHGNRSLVWVTEHRKRCHFRCYEWDHPPALWHVAQWQAHHSRLTTLTADRRSIQSECQTNIQREPMVTNLTNNSPNGLLWVSIKKQSLQGFFHERQSKGQGTHDELHTPYEVHQFIPAGALLPVRFTGCVCGICFLCASIGRRKEIKKGWERERKRREEQRLLAEPQSKVPAGLATS